jgi:hypothetical protein
VASDDQALSKQLEKVPKHVACALASDELRAHIENFSGIQNDIQDLRRGLIYLREFAVSHPGNSRAHDVHALSEKALEQLSQVTKDLGYFNSQPSRAEIPEDLATLEQLLRDRRPHSAAERQFEAALSHVMPLCANTVTALEYVIRVYKMDLEAFPAAPGQSWYVTIQENSRRREETARAAIETLQEITRN